MKTAIITIGLVVLLVGGSASAVENKDFYSDGNIMTGEQWNIVSIYDTPPDHTTVNMLGGLVDVLKPYNASTFNMTFGEIYTLSAWEFSTVNVSGGSLSHIFAEEYSIINFSNQARGVGIGVNGSATMNMIGGTVDSLGALDNGIINIHGGFISNSLGAGENAVVNVFGYDLTKTPSGGNYGYGQVYGFFMDDSAFTIDLYNAPTYSHINLIPEPATFLLLALGGIFLRKQQ